MLNDHDGLRFVDLTKNVEISPHITHISQENMTGKEYLYILTSEEVLDMLSQLTQMGELRLITDTIQSLTQKTDGTLLQSAFPDIVDIKSCVSRGLKLPQGLIEKMDLWEAQNFAAINFDFEEYQQPVA